MPLPFLQKRDMIILVSMPACRNGRRGRLKICCRQLRVGSSPTAGTFSYFICYINPVKSLILRDFLLFRISKNGKGCQKFALHLPRGFILLTINLQLFQRNSFYIAKEDPPAFQRFLFSFTQSASQTHQTVFILLISNYARSSSSSIFSKIGKQSKVAK